MAKTFPNVAGFEHFKDADPASTAKGLLCPVIVLGISIRIESRAGLPEPTCMTVFLQYLTILVFLPRFYRLLAGKARGSHSH